MVVRSFEVNSRNTNGNAIKVRCRTNSPLSCEVSVVPLCESNLRWLYYVLMTGMMFGILAKIPSAWKEGIFSHNWITIAVASLCMAGLWLKYSYFKAEKDTVTVIKNIGIQIKTAYSSGRESSVFIDHKSIGDIIINEAITMQCVIYYLAIIQIPDTASKKPNQELMPLFMSFYPRLDALKPIYHIIRSVLYNEQFGGDTIYTNNMK